MNGPQDARLFYRKLCKSLADRGMTDGFFTDVKFWLFFSFFKKSLVLAGTSSKILKLYYFVVTTCNSSNHYPQLVAYPAPSRHILSETAKSPLFKTWVRGKSTFMMENISMAALEF